ncbi:MAG: lamin tail domain-containing protein [bacterium]|nr:lamin tail domain-containing protein [bacterium]
MNFPILLVLLYPIITEVMVDPAGSETGSLSPGDRNEFVEVYNPDDDTVDMAFLKIKDNAEADSIVPFTEILQFCPRVKATTKIPPKSYGVIFDREYILEGENYLPYTLTGEVSVMTTKDTDLGNGLSSNDTICIIDGNGNILSSFGLGSGFPLRTRDGVAFERKYYWGPDNGENWKYCEDESGNTCGRENSVSKPFNIRIEELKLERLEECELSFVLKVLNIGTEFLGFLKLRYEITGAIPPSEEERSVFLYPDSAVLIEIGPLLIPPGSYPFKIWVGVQDLFVDSTFLPIFSGKPPLVINEIMYNGDVEWVEIYNASNGPLSLKGFFVGDPVKRSEPAPDIVLEPDSYYVFSSTEVQVSNSAVLKNFPTLNNTGDTIFLYDAYGQVVDMVAYSMRWGGSFNVSLERLSPFLPSNSPYSWASSKDGNTMGRKNSIQILPPRTGALLSLSSKALAPSRGVPAIAVRVEFPEFPVYATGELYRLDGRKVQTFFSEKLLMDGEMDFTVTGYANGTQLEEGMYILVVNGRTLQGKLFSKKELIGVLR